MIVFMPGANPIKYVSSKNSSKLVLNFKIIGESCGLAVAHSAHDQKVVGSIPMLDGNGVKAMPGSIPTPSSGSL